VPARPYVVLSAAVSADGCTDDASSTRLMLSGPEDADRVDELRAGCDAILVGANTIRADDPALLVRSRCRRVAREEKGSPPNPVKVTVSRTGDGLDGTERFFTSGDASKLVYLPRAAAPGVQARLGAAATVVGIEAAGLDGVDLAALLADLAGRGVGRLLAEGGTQVRSQFLAAGLADELQLAVAPFLVADSRAPRLVRSGGYPLQPPRRMRLAGLQEAGDMAVLRYTL
jgi:5-amino-6-(5-phosphoribosylamino)uracil reductase